MSDAPEEKDWAEEEELLIELDPETGRLEGVGRGLDYGPRVARLFPEAYDYATLLEDAKIVDGSEEASFWLACDAEPRSELERLALAIFRAHVPAGEPHDRSRSGAEWWIQRRTAEGRDAAAAELAGASIPFHWDADETLKGLYSLYLHPPLSTVTYLTHGGAPTCVAPMRVAPDGALDLGVEAPSLLLAYPTAGKHLCFDGRLLHAAPDALARTPFAGARVTFLVNVWLDHVPCGIQRYAGPPLSLPAAGGPGLLCDSVGPTAVPLAKSDVTHVFPLRAAEDLVLFATLPPEAVLRARLPTEEGLYELAFPAGGGLVLGAFDASDDGEDREDEEGGARKRARTGDVE
jgi:hypothetical protein